MSIIIYSLNDLRQFGIEPLTGEADGTNCRRILCDFTTAGRRLLASVFGIPFESFHGAEPWNNGSADDPHVGSILLTTDLVPLLGIVALLDRGYTVGSFYKTDEDAKDYFDADGVYGFAAHEKDDLQTQLALANEVGWAMRQYYRHGTAGDRNVHQMSGRAE